MDKIPDTWRTQNIILDTVVTSSLQDNTSNEEK